MKSIKNRIIGVITIVAITALAAIAAPGASNESAGGDQQVVKKVQHELATLPYYGVFDNLAYRVDGNTVTLYGQVVQGVTRSDAEQRVAKVSGVERVINNIEVLPPSPFDDQLRLRTYRTVFRTGGLYRYAMGANPSIHIVVKGGHVTLEGVVANQADANLANIAANSVPGVFSVTNNLRSERSGKRAY